MMPINDAKESPIATPIGSRHQIQIPKEGTGRIRTLQDAMDRAYQHALRFAHR